jgi:hypothetical protein
MCQYLSSKKREHLLLNKLKNTLVSVEPRYRDPATGLQHDPLFGMDIQVALITGERDQTKGLKPFLDALVDLASHVAIAGSAEVKPWQALLQKLNALRILHRQCA